MTFTDTHTHLYDERLIADPEQISRAVNAGVSTLYMPNCNSETITGMLKLADQYPDVCFPMMGLHPCYVKDNYKEELDLVSDWLTKRKFYAVGEIGLDYYWDVTHKSQQIEAFEAQIDLALKYDLPIVIHSRNSTPDCIEVVRRKQDGNLRGIFHCFSGTTQDAADVVQMGFHLGIGGVVTYKNTNLPEILNEVDLSHIVLETDAPYLAPIPYRGKRNESSYIPYIAARIAEIKNINIEIVAIATTENARRIFQK